MDARLPRSRAVLFDLSVLLTEPGLHPDATGVLTALREAGLRTAVVSDRPDGLPVAYSQLPIAYLVDTEVFAIHIGHCVCRFRPLDRALRCAPCAGGRCEPHPAMYLTACARLGVAPAECLFVGAGGSPEVSGARALGMAASSLTEVLAMVGAAPALIS
jgi:putative hydrolase of the HAD superfamily